MPREARLDAPGTLHHVMAQGMEGTDVFRTDEDRNDFLTRLAYQCEIEALRVYARTLIPNHFHLLVRTIPDLGALVKEVAKRQEVGEERLKVERRT